MVVLVALLQTTQDADGRHLVRLVNHHRLEPSLQRLVLLEILLVFVQRRGTDGAQLASRKGRLQDVGGIHGTLRSTGTHQRVDLVDEEYDAALALGHLVHHALQSLLELTLVLCTGNQLSHVEREQLLVLQVLGNVAAHDSLRQTLHDGRLTRSRLTDKYRVVLRASREDLQHAPYFVVAADDGVEFSRTGIFHQVLRILRKALVVLVGALRLYLLSLPQFLDGLFHVLGVHSRILHNARCRGVHLQQGHHHGFHADELVAPFLRDVLRLHQHLVGLVREIRLSALYARQVLQLAVHQLCDMPAVHPQLLEDERHHVGGFFHHPLQYVYRLDHLL